MINSQNNKQNKMKNALLLIALVFTTLTTAQNTNYIGNYEKKTKADDKLLLEYELSIKADSTFTFHFFRNNGQFISVDENSYAKGTWKVIKNIIYFYTDKETELDEKHQLNFTNSSGRMDHKDKKLFRFYHSDIFWVDKLTLTKIE